MGCAALAWTLCASPVFANSPSKAEQARVSVREAVGALPPNAALERLAKEGYRLKDPLLLLDAGEEALARATEIEDVEALGRARAHVSVAFDMLAYLQAPRAKRRRCGAAPARGRPPRRAGALPSNLASMSIVMRSASSGSL